MRAQGSASFPQVMAKELFSATMAIEAADGLEATLPQGWVEGLIQR